MTFSRVALLLVAFLFFVSPFTVSARNAKHFKPGKYWQVGKDEYAKGEITNAAIPPTQPQQILTSLSGTPGQITVTWVTMAAANTTVQWGSSPTNMDSSNTGFSFDFVDPEKAHILRIVHTAHITDLKPKSTISYRVGDATTNNWSDTLTFVAPPNGEDILNLIVYGDMGVVNAQSMQNVLAEVNSGSAHMVLHLGDYAYDLHTNNGSFGDTFMNNIQPIASRVPYLGGQGNHEGKYNASHYRNRFTAYKDLGMTSGSGSDNNWWFSWEYLSGGAKVHFVAINTEMYYDYVDDEVAPDYSSQRKAQYAWLDADLAKARANSDWVIVYGHRPMYCSDVDSLGDCTSDAQVLREGYKGDYGMDAMIAKHHVDIYFTAHEHSYERTLPVYAGMWDPQQNHTHLNPKYPVHIVTGSAGCVEGLEWFDNVFIPAWSVVRSGTYGYGHLVVHNATHLYWDQLLDEGKQGLDTLWIVQTKSKRGLKTGTALVGEVTRPWTSAQ